MTLGNKCVVSLPLVPVKGDSVLPDFLKLTENDGASQIPAIHLLKAEHVWAVAAPQFG